MQYDIIAYPASRAEEITAEQQERTSTSSFLLLHACMAHMIVLLCGH